MLAEVVDYGLEISATSSFYGNLLVLGFFKFSHLFINDSVECNNVDTLDAISKELG